MSNHESAEANADKQTKNYIRRHGTIVWTLSTSSDITRLPQGQPRGIQNKE